LRENPVSASEARRPPELKNGSGRNAGVSKLRLSSGRLSAAFVLSDDASSLRYVICSSLPTRPDSKMAASHIFKVVFVNQGKVYEIYARKVSHGSLFGFIEVEELVFGERSLVVVDPSEEKVKAEFEGVKRTYLPLHSVLRVDEVRKQGVSKVSAVEGGSNVAQFPMPMYTPGDGKK
jgi:hypothetical protein